MAPCNIVEKLFLPIFLYILSNWHHRDADLAISNVPIDVQKTRDALVEVFPSKSFSAGHPINEIHEVFICKSLSMIFISEFHN